MRIAYGVHGYGRGHATRALAVLAELSRRHDVLIFAGGDAHETMSREYRIVRIPTLGYYYRKSGTRSNWLTFKHNLRAIVDLTTRGPAFQTVVNELEDFRPDVAICDAEPWTNRAAGRLGVPRISFDHFGVMAYCRTPMRVVDRLLSWRDVTLYRWLMKQPERVLVSSFFDAPPRRPGVSLIGTLLRDEVFDFRASDGEYLLGYFNKGEHLFSKRIERALRAIDCPVIVYGTRRRGRDGQLEFRAPDNRAFLEDLAGARAVISTAGNQLVGEALHYGKPMLVLPEDCVEQRINAAAVERMGIGLQASQHHITKQTIRDFLSREAEFREAARHAARDSRREAVEAIEQLIDELTGGRSRRTMATRVA